MARLAAFGLGLGLEELLFRSLVLGEIAEDQDDAVNLARGIADRSAAVIDGDLAAILADQERMVGQADDHARAGRPLSTGLSTVFRESSLMMQKISVSGFSLASAMDHPVSCSAIGVHEGEAAIEIAAP